MGAGRAELLECVMGQHPAARGQVTLDGVPLADADVAARIGRDIALIPEDRKRVGLVQMMAIRENLTLSALAQMARYGHLKLRAEGARAAEFVCRLSVKITNLENPVASLSGGNQQKVVIGKALMTWPKVLLMDEPSRGIRAKAEVFRTMRTLAGGGLGVLFVTSDLDEVMALSDRILVMAEGRLTGEFPAGTDPARIVAASSPAQSRKSPA